MPKELFYNHLPDDALLVILYFLSPISLTLSTRLTSKRLKKLSDSNRIWSTFIEEDKTAKYKDKETSKNGESSYKSFETQDRKTYIKDPAARKLGYIGYDQAGRNYLKNSIASAREKPPDIQGGIKKYLLQGEIKYLLGSNGTTLRNSKIITA